jgi:hypothetical protein
MPSQGFMPERGKQVEGQESEKGVFADFANLICDGFEFLGGRRGEERL